MKGRRLFVGWNRCGWNIECDRIISNIISKFILSSLL